MLIDEIRGRLAYRTQNRELNRISQQKYGKKLFGARWKTHCDGCAKLWREHQKNMVEAHVTNEMEARIRRSRYRLQRKLKRRFTFGRSLRTHDKVAKLTRQELEVTNRQIKLVALITNPDPHFEAKLVQPMELRDKLR